MSWWRRSPPAAEPRRWAVVDVETSGLDPAHDRLLAIAGVALELPEGGTPRIVLGDSFEVVLRADEAAVAAPDKANILVHGIGIGAQRAGLAPAEALAAFEAWIGDAPLVGYHAAFDEAVIRRAMRLAGRKPPPNPWLDLAPVAPVAWPQRRGEALDDWLAHAGIACLERHRAAADALATAELLQSMWPALRAQRVEPTLARLRKLAADARWLPRA